MGTAGLPGTVLRLPTVYGPGDYQHRLFEYLKRMDDGRPAILLGEGVAS
jgi:nucleoside-diphosphate-sugar epimerase